MQQPEYIKVAVSLDDGTVAVMSFVTLGRGSTLPSNAEWVTPGIWRRSPLDGELFEEISRAFTTGPAIVSYQLVKEGDIPKDRTYRDAWTFDGKSIIHDTAEAEALQLSRLRQERKEKFAELDAEWMKAVATNPKKAAAVEAERQLLRDMPSRFAEACKGVTNVDGLKQLTLDSV